MTRTLPFRTTPGVTFGVLAFNGGPAFGGWSYANGFVNFETGDVENASDASGTFTPGTPGLISIQFDKSLFPHGDSADNRLVAFKAATAEFKAPAPVWIAQSITGQDVPVEPPFFLCDLAEGAGAYTFQVGGHSQHGAPAPTSEEGNLTAPTTSTPAAGSLNATGGADGDEEKGAPGPGALLVLAAVGLALAATRRRA